MDINKTAFIIHGLSLKGQPPMTILLFPILSRPHINSLRLSYKYDSQWFKQHSLFHSSVYNQTTSSLVSPEPLALFADDNLFLPSSLHSLLCVHM